MRWGSVVVVVLAVLAVLVPWRVAAGAFSWQGIGDIDDKCTVWAVRPRLLVTASHCVHYPTTRHTVTYYRGVTGVSMEATVVWDGAYIEWYPDLALLVPDQPWPVTYPIARTIPPRGTRLELVGHFLTLRHFSQTITVLGLYFSPPDWLLVTTSLGRGFSGAAAFWGGEVAGVAVGSSTEYNIGFLVPAGWLARAIRSLDKDGPMSNPY
jgi:hypothetical protein